MNHRKGKLYLGRLGLIIIMFTISLIMASCDDESTESSSSSSTDSSSSHPKEVVSTPAGPTPLDDATSAVSSFKEMELAFGGHIGVYHDILQDIDNGDISAADGYNKLDRLNDSTLNLFQKAQTMKVPKKYKDDQDQLVMALSYLQNSIGSIKKYLDDHKTSTLAEAQKDVQTAIGMNEDVKEKISSEASADGYKTPDGQPIFK